MTTLYYAHYDTLYEYAKAEREDRLRRSQEAHVLRKLREEQAANESSRTDGYTWLRSQFARLEMRWMRLKMNTVATPQ